MFTTAQAMKLYEYDLAALESAGKRERLLEEPLPREFIIKSRAPNGVLRVPIGDLLSPGAREELRRRFL